MADIKTSLLGGGKVPSGTTAERSTKAPSPAIGDQYYNGTLGVLEIYTTSGWLPATGANDFNVTLNGTVTTATFTKEYFAGAYTIASALLDSSYDIYVYGTDGTISGYTKTPSLTATGNFNKIVILGGTSGDLLSFSYKTTFTATNTTAEITAGAFITSVTPTALNSIDDTTVVAGGNFASNVAVYFVGSDNIERAAKSVVRSSASSLIVTRPDNFPTDLGTYKIIVENPGITRPTGSSLHILNNAVTAGTTPNWTTATTLPEIGKGFAYSTTLVATDTEGTDIDYSVVSGTLPSGITLNSETGVLSGTYSGSDFNTTNLVIRAVDTGGNTVDRTFTIFSLDPVWSTSTLAGYTASTSYSQQLTATDNNSITYTLNSGSSLPAGLSLSSSGLISGTAPSGSSTYTFTIRATDSVGNYTNRQFSLANSFVTSSTGGQTITSGGYKYHLFKTVGNDTFTAGGSGTAEVLVVAGGGAGDNDHGGGGGAGGVLYHSAKSLTAGNYTVTVGAGGAANSGTPLNGSNSVFDNLIANGGGRGSTTNADSGGAGGSGGGGGGSNSGTGTRAGGSANQTSMNGATGYGNNGGTGGGSSGEPGGGGGGAGQVGGNSTSDTAGKGGNGLNTWSTWLSAVSSLVTGDTLTVYNSGYIAGGGGGGHTNANTGNTGGLGGGGNGGLNATVGPSPFSGVANTGGGGGSHGNGGTNGGDGGSGVVIVRYAV